MTGTVATVAATATVVTLAARRKVSAAVTGTAAKVAAISTVVTAAKAARWRRGVSSGEPP